MSANYDSKVLVWKKEIEKKKGAIRLLEEIKRDQIPTDSHGENVIDVQRPRMANYSSYEDETGAHVLQLLEKAHANQDIQLQGFSSGDVELALNDLRSQRLPIFKLVSAH